MTTEHDSSGVFMEAALRIGKRICRQAIWRDGMCTWEISVPDMTKPGQHVARRETAGGIVYQGTAGIGLFLLELYKITCDPDVGRTCRAAIRYAADEGEKLPPNSFGFHSGRVGIAYSMLEFARRFDDERLALRGRKMLEEMVGHETQDVSLDVIGGAAGAIPALMRLYRKHKLEVALGLGVNLGKFLISKAVMRPRGWSWRTLTMTSVKDLCGYAHGNAGMGHAFMELYNTTSLSRYLYSAEQAFLYERQFFNDSRKNWPDFRYSELSDYVDYNRFEELRSAVRDGHLAPYKPQFMNAWCHGAPGIGLSRLRAYEICGNEAYLKEASLAIDGTAASLKPNSGNYSLCHGIGGNCETLLLGHRLLNDSGYRDAAEQIGLDGINKFENLNLPWPCGTVGGGSDPSLMLGESGIGYFLLRLSDQDVPSLLCLSSGSAGEKPEVGESSFRNLQERYVGAYFRNTLHVIEDNFATSPSQDGQRFDIGRIESDVDVARRMIEELIRSMEGSGKKEALDIYNIEKCRLEYAACIDDFTSCFLDSLARVPSAEIEWDESQFEINNDCRLLRSNFDWSAMLDGRSDKDSQSAQRSGFYLIHTVDSDARISAVSPFTYLILEACRKPRTLGDLTRFILPHVSTGSSGIVINELGERIKGQVVSAYTAGILKLSHSKCFNETGSLPGLSAYAE